MANDPKYIEFARGEIAFLKKQIEGLEEFIRGKGYDPYPVPTPDSPAPEPRTRARYK